MNPLEIPFTEKEVRLELMSIDSNKAPSPGGF